MAQLRLLVCSPSSSTLSFSQTPPSLLLSTGSTLPSRNSSLSLSSSHTSFRSFPCFSSFRRPLFSVSAVAVQEEQISVETETELEEFSKTRLCAQNIPWSSTADDIRALFENHGTVLGVELSMHNKRRNRGLAFVEMGSPEEASEALNKLEEYEFEGRILKMNYAKPRTKKPSLPPMPPKKPVSYELFVGSLSYDASAEDLKEFFSSEGYNLVTCGVVLLGDPKKSAGYGFVSFATKKEAETALSTLVGKELMGRPIQLERSKRFVRILREPKPKSDDVASISNPVVDQVEESEDS
ncbi:hypothetical protein V2J09_008546 [Rumex salicifolius]